MKNLEKTAIVRIFVDLIKADRIIDTGEIVFYEEMRRKYGFTKDNEVAAMSMRFSKAIAILRESEKEIRDAILSDCADATVSDGFCAHSEALLLITLKRALGDDNSDEVNVVSIPKKNFSADDSTVLYVESLFNANINQQIIENYRSVYKEFLFSGFHFVYIPNVIRHYRETEKSMFKRMISFLAPSFSDEGLDNVVDNLLTMSTESFCKDILCNRLGIEKLREVNPSILIKIGCNQVDDVEYSNFLCIEVDYDFVTFVNKFVDEFSSMLSSDALTVPVGKEADDQYFYYGFYKQLLDIYLVRRNIRSRIVIDPCKEEIIFPDIDQKLSGLTRKEKAMYVLFLILMEDKGFSFNSPQSTGQMKMYQKRMATLLKQYSMIYCFMGGDKDKIPDITSSEIRRPIFSRIKKSISCMSDMLYNVNDYLIMKNSYGTYNVNVEENLIFVKDWKSGNLVPLQTSDIVYRVRESL